MGEDVDRARAALPRIGEQALQTNRRRAAQLGEAVGRLAAGQLDEAARLAAQRVAHQLTGSAGTFGYPGVSRLAQQLQDVFDRHPSHQLVPLAEALLRDIRAGLDKDPVGLGTDDYLY